MWDGNFQSIPHMWDVSSTAPCSKVNELDLSSNSLNLSLCHILRVWDLRLTKRMDKLGSTRFGGCGNPVRRWDGSSVTESSCAIMSHQFYEDDGPLNIAYQRVFSIEVSQFDDNYDDDGNNIIMVPQADGSARQSITNLVMAAFRDGGSQLKRVLARKRRHAVRRIRIFFYNKYADAIACALRDLSEGGRQQQQQKGLGKHKSIPLMTLAKVPGKCILPYSLATPGHGSPHPHVQQYALNPIGD